jgi:hypothetical protein
MHWNIKIWSMLLIVACLLSVASCFSDDEYEQVVTIRPDPKEIINATVAGLILDENDRPIANAQVALHVVEGVVTQETDEEGFFLFVHQRIPASAYVVVEQGNKFAGRRRIPVSEGQIAYTEIKLFEREVKGSFLAQDGGIVRLDNSILTMPANCLEDQSGTLYSGSVNVFYHSVGPLDEDFQHSLIGDLSGVDEQGAQKSLISIGMFIFELMGMQGQALKFSKNCGAILEYYTMPDENLSSVPIWYFNEELGEWLEESSGQVFGGDLVGVSMNRLNRTGSWNFDYKENPINISGKINFNMNGDIQQAPVGFLQVFVSSDDLGKRGGYLMSDQRFLFNNFPAGRAFNLTVEDECENVMYSSAYGPFESDQILNDISIFLDGNPTLVTGIAVDCDDAIVEDGLVQMVYSSGKKYLNSFQNGTVSIVVDEQFDCGQSDGVDVEIIDRATQLSYQTDILSLNEPSIQLDTITTCDLPSEYIEFKIDGENYIICPDPTVNLAPIGENSSFGCGTFDVTIPDLISIGSYSDTIFISVAIGGGIYDHVDPQNLNIIVTQFGTNTNDVFAGNIEGQVRKVLGGGNFGDPVNLIGSFRIVVD